MTPTLPPTSKLTPFMRVVPTLPSSECIMADLERQNISIELRKFRKKLRQIEKLEELERDLTEEEFLKVTDS